MDAKGATKERRQAAPQLQAAEVTGLCTRAADSSRGLAMDRSTFEPSNTVTDHPLLASITFGSTAELKEFE